MLFPTIRAVISVVPNIYTDCSSTNKFSVQISGWPFCTVFHLLYTYKGLLCVRKDRLQTHLRKDWATQTFISGHPNVPTHRLHINHRLKNNFDHDVILNNINMFIHGYVEISSETLSFVLLFESTMHLTTWTSFSELLLIQFTASHNTWQQAKKKILKKDKFNLYSNCSNNYSCCLHRYSKCNLPCSDVRSENRLNKIWSKKAAQQRD